MSDCQWDSYQRKSVLTNEIKEAALSGVAISNEVREEAIELGIDVDAIYETFAGD